MKIIKDELGFELEIDENLSDEDWNNKLEAHGKWLIETAEMAGENLVNNHARIPKCPECLEIVSQEELDMFGGMCEECIQPFDN